VAIADGRANGLAALDESSFDLIIVDAFMQAEPHRKYVATLSAIAQALSEPHGNAKARGGRERRHQR
jgi:hypothetical protein